MQQHNKDPLSLSIFKMAIGAISCLILTMIFTTIYGEVKNLTALTLGFGGTIIFNFALKRQIEYSYWWIRIFLELNSDSGSEKD
jgi:hypothetical protein